MTTLLLDAGEDSLYVAIVKAIKRDIRAGKLPPGHRLPPHRELADELGVAVGTVTRAYAEAERQGLVRGEVGRGTFVAGPEERASNRSVRIPQDTHGFIDLSLNYPLYADDPDLAAEEEGGVYVALTVSRIEGPKAAAAALALPTHESSSGPWRFLSFPPASPVAAVFFSVGSAIVQDPDSLVDHVPGVTGLSEAWLEGGAEVVSLLERLGALRCRSVEAPDGRTGEQLALSRGRLVIVPPRAAGRPRVLGVVLGLQEDGGGTVHPHRGFWVRYEKQAGAPLARRR
jgi:DNA-binding transcriptional regulator YhcF (GntR family)